MLMYAGIKTKYLHKLLTDILENFDDITIKSA
jgi:hypothetical protein